MRIAVISKTLRLKNSSKPFEEKLCATVNKTTGRGEIVRWQRNKKQPLVIVKGIFFIRACASSPRRCAYSAGNKTHRDRKSRFFANSAPREGERSNIYILWYEGSSRSLWRVWNTTDVSSWKFYLVVRQKWWVEKALAMYYLQFEFLFIHRSYIWMCRVSDKILYGIRHGLFHFPEI